MTGIKSFLLQNKSAGQTIAKNTIWLTASRLFGHLIKAGLLIYAARVLGTTSYGVFSYALSIAVLFSIIADFGVGGLVTRNLSSTEGEQKPLLMTSLVIKLCLISASMLLVLFVAPVLTKIPEAAGLLPIIAVLIMLDGAREFLLSINRAKERMEIEAMILMLTNTFIVLIGLVTLMFLRTSGTLLLAYTIGSGLGFLVALLLLGKYLAGIWHHFNKGLVKMIVRESWPFALFGLLGVVMINTDIVMLGFFRDASRVGLYSAAQKPIQVIYMIPAVIAMSFLPAVTKLANRDNARFKKFLEQTVTATLLIGTPIVLGGIILGRGLIDLVFGAEYLDATLAFQLLLVTVFIVFPSIVIANAVFAYNQQKSFVGFLLLGAVGNIVFNLILMPKYGISGSAVATIGAELIANAFIWTRMKKINHFVILPHLKRILPAAAAMAGMTVLMQYLGVNLLLNIMLSAAAYFLLLKLFKEPLLKAVTALTLRGMQ